MASRPFSVELICGTPARRRLDERPAMRTLEEFRDLKLRGPDSRRAEFRAALIANASDGWRHAPEREEHASAYSRDADVVAFEHEKSNDLASAGLILWWRPGMYEVTNIVPIELRELKYGAYNALLNDFVAKVVAPIAGNFGFTIETTKDQQSLDDWVPKHVADALRSFSGAANKGTGSSHPMDQGRWFAFIIAVHECGADLDTNRLMRWLCEIEGWSDDMASDLAIEYEQGLGLLKQYDAQSGR
jgi:hypothetical protein